MGYRISKEGRYRDDFDWDTYTPCYAAQLAHVAEKHTLCLSQGHYCVVDGRVVLDEGLPSLYAHHEAVYETVLDLQPCSVMEVGCGGGDHLSNIQKLLPGIELHGCDRSAGQLAFLRQRHPDLDGIDVFLHDIVVTALPFQAELVYTQNVLQHIATGRHLAALWHLVAAATKYVILAENWRCHDWYRDLRVLSTMRYFPWEEIHFYTNTATRQYLLICSREPLPCPPYQIVVTDENQYEHRRAQHSGLQS